MQCSLRSHVLTVLRKVQARQLKQFIQDRFKLDLSRTDEAILDEEAPVVVSTTYDEPQESAATTTKQPELAFTSRRARLCRAMDRAAKRGKKPMLQTFPQKKSLSGPLSFSFDDCDV